MRIQPRLAIGLAIYLLYSAWVIAVWMYRGIDFRAIGTEAGLLVGVVQPLAVAAFALALWNSGAGWWRATLFDPERARRPVLFAIVAALMLGFIVATLGSVNFAAFAPSHLVVLAVATLLVGFCEEMVTRGVLLVSLRARVRSEARVWLLTSALFGLMHASNALFGVGAAALLQVVLAFCAGSGLYLLRRFSGTLLLPMLVHALWDFSTLASAQGNAAPSLAATALLLGSYVGSVVIAVLVVRGDRALVAPPAAS